MKAETILSQTMLLKSIFDAQTIIPKNILSNDDCFFRFLEHVITYFILFMIEKIDILFDWNLFPSIDFVCIEIQRQ